MGGLRIQDCILCWAAGILGYVCIRHCLAHKKINKRLCVSYAIVFPSYLVGASI